MSPYKKRVSLQIQLGMILCCQTSLFFQAFSFQIYYPKDPERVLYFIELSVDIYYHLKKYYLFCKTQLQSQQNL